MSQNVKRESFSLFQAECSDNNSSSEPQQKKCRVDGNQISDVLVPVNPVAALKNLIELPKLMYKSQDEPTKIFTVSVSFHGQHFEAADCCDFERAEIKLASQILHSFILRHAFAENSPLNGSSNLSTSYHARIIEGNNDSVYIVGQEENVKKPADEMLYTLYEIEPETKFSIGPKCNSLSDASGMEDHVATVILNGVNYSGSGNRKEMAEKEAKLCALSSFTPENMGYSSNLRCPSQAFNVSSAITSTTSPQTDGIQQSSAIKYEKKKKLRFYKKSALSTLLLLQPPTDCVIIKSDVNSDGTVMYTARVTIGGVHYDHDATSKKTARKNAAFLALSSLSPEEAEKLINQKKKKLASDQEAKLQERGRRGKLEKIIDDDITHQVDRYAGGDTDESNDKEITYHPLNIVNANPNHDLADKDYILGDYIAE